MSKPIEVTKENPCPHCGKGDYCYRLEPLSVCNRDHPPADGWYQTSKTDQDGHYYYAPIKEKTTKKARPLQKRIWEYPDRNGNPLVRVIRIDDGNGGKPKRWQEKWDGEKWVKGLKGVKRENIPIYRYQKIIEAILQGQTIYVVEGETCADALWKLGIPATTNIGGSKKWRHSDTLDLIEGIQQRAEGRRHSALRIDPEAEDKNNLTKNSQQLDGEAEDKNHSTEDKNHSTEDSPQLDGEAEDKNHLTEDSPQIDREAEEKNHSTKELSTVNCQLSTVLCPDGDIPGVKHMEAIAVELEQANIDVKIKWLYAFPDSPLWKKIPSSGGLDVVDWIADYQLKAEDIINSVEPKRLNLVENQSATPSTSEWDDNSSTEEEIAIGNNYTQMCVEELYSDKRC